MKTVVIHHRADFDGIFCREIAKHFLPDAELIGWHYGDPKIPMTHEGIYYILDLSPDCLGGDTYDSSRIIWIDHHKSAIEKYPSTIPGYRIDGVAACRLAWQFFSKWSKNAIEISKTILPSKQDYVDRIVSEPMAVRLAGEYDIWDKRDPRAELFQHGLRSRDLDGWWEGLLFDQQKCSIDEVMRLQDKHHKVDLLPNGNVKIEGLGAKMVEDLLKRGEAIQYVQTEQNASIIKAIGFDLDFEGLHFLACNHARYNSFLFTAGLKPEHDACFGFKWTGKFWEVSLYHAPGKEHHDLSLIAVKHGGGGHKGACGFRLDKLPFVK